MNNLDREIIEDLQTVKIVKVKNGCCKSYLTPKGRCYTCAEKDNW